VKASRVNALRFDDTHAEAVANIHAHASYGRNRYRVLKAKFKPDFRRNLASPVTADLGEKIEASQQAAVAEKREQQSLGRKIQTCAKQLGVSAELVRHGDHYEADGLADMLQAEREQAALDAKQQRDAEGAQ
jgi:hypothetical protein